MEKKRNMAGIEPDALMPGTLCHKKIHVAAAGSLESFQVFCLEKLKRESIWCGNNGKRTV